MTGVAFSPSKRRDFVSASIVAILDLWQRNLVVCHQYRQTLWSKQDGKSKSSNFKSSWMAGLSPWNRISSRKLHRQSWWPNRPVSAVLQVYTFYDNYSCQMARFLYFFNNTLIVFWFKQKIIAKGLNCVCLHRKVKKNLMKFYFVICKVFNEMKRLFSLRHLLNLFEVNLNLDHINFYQIRSEMSNNCWI